MFSPTIISSQPKYLELNLTRAIFIQIGTCSNTKGQETMFFIVFHAQNLSLISIFRLC